MTTQAAPSAAVATTVATAEGPVRGLAHDGYSTFFAVPYAAAPIGPLAFAPPEPAPHRTDELDATAFGTIFDQDLDPLPFAIPPTQHNFFHPDATLSQDSATVNIWTPDVTGSAPVLVWIHGGAFMYGSGTGSWTDGAKHARDHGVVVVSVNYRLGIPGGMYLSDLRPGWANVGLQDQIQALRWIRDNIASFGGSPADVTVGGQSAGAMSVAALLVSPMAEGLFRRAIVQSGHLAVTTSIADAVAARNTVVGQLGLDPDSPTLIEELQQVNILLLMAVQRVNGLDVRMFPLVEDGDVIPQAPLDVLRSGARKDVDLLLGINSEEDRLFTLTGWAAGDEVSLADDLRRTLTDEGDVEQAITLYSAIGGTNDRGRRYLFATDHGWGSPNRELALAHADGGGRVFQYEFAWQSTALDGRVGAAHLVELPFTFDCLDSPGTGSLLGDDSVADDDVQALARAIATAWTGFISTGDPSGSPLGEWSPFTRSTPMTLVIDVYPSLVRDRNSTRLDFCRNAASVAPLTALSD